MPPLPAVMVTLLLPFQRLFDPRTWRKAQLLADGSDPVSRQAPCPSALNILGIGQHGDFAVYHHVLNRRPMVATATEGGLKTLLVARAPRFLHRAVGVRH